MPPVRPPGGRAAEFGCPNVIVLSGNRRGMSGEDGFANCAAFLTRVKARAEDAGVTVCLELLNSKMDHEDYPCDHAAGGFDVVQRVIPPRVKLLSAVYRMQILERNVIRTIAHAILDTGFTGYFAHGHSPAGDPLSTWAPKPSKPATSSSGGPPCKSFAKRNIYFVFNYLYRTFVPEMFPYQWPL